MKKFLLLGAAALAFSTTANASTFGNPTPIPLNDQDGSSYHVTVSGDMPDNQGEDYGSPISAQFTMTGTVLSTCSIQGVDSSDNFFASNGNGLVANIELGTIGINAGDDTSLGDLFTMTGDGHVNIHSGAAGCNYNNKLTLAKNDLRGLVNLNPGGFDSTQFQANIPYSADATFSGVGYNVQGAGTTQHVTVSTGQDQASGLFGAWKSPLDLNVTIPKASLALVGGTYQGTLTMTLQLN